MSDAPRYDSKVFHEPSSCQRLRLDVLCGTAILNGVRVQVAPDAAPAPA